MRLAVSLGTSRRSAYAAHGGFNFGILNPDCSVRDPFEVEGISERQSVSRGKLRSIPWEYKPGLPRVGTPCLSIKVRGYIVERDDRLGRHCEELIADVAGLYTIGAERLSSGTADSWRPSGIRRNRGVSWREKNLCLLFLMHSRWRHLYHSGVSAQAFEGRKHKY